MGAFKQFLSTDVTVVPFVVNKSFSFEGTASMDAVGIQRLFGRNYTYSSSADNTNSIYQSQSSALIWNSTKQLYYTNYISPSSSFTPPQVYDYNGNLIEDYTDTSTNTRFFNYEQTSLIQINTGSSYPVPIGYGYRRYFITSSGAQIGVISIPKDIFGDYINPKTFYYRSPINNATPSVIQDNNGDGIITITSIPVGIINYTHGTIVYTNSPDKDYFQNTDNVTCSFQSSRTIFETQYKCTIRPDEFNYSLNPSLQLTGSAVLFSGSIWTNYTSSNNGTLRDFATGSYFAPYVTTVGLYNENQELLAVAKLAQPLPTSRTTDTTILINLDR
jgi:hypothetical protein